MLCWLASNYTLRNLVVTTYVTLLGADCAVDDEVDGAVDDEGEVLDGSESEHPARVDWQ